MKNAQLKTHIKFRKVALCGNRHAKRFVAVADDFDNIPEEEKCGNCKRASAK